MLSFLTSGPARFRFRAHFDDVDYANISFFSRDRREILFHLSLRADEGRAVCNRRGPDEVWGREIARKLPLARDGAHRGIEVEIAFDAPHVRVRIDGVERFHFGPGLAAALGRHRFPWLEWIGFVDFQGGILPGSFDIDMRLPGDAPAAPLALDRRLELRGRLHRPAGSSPLRLEIPGTEPPPELIVQETGPDQVDVRAVLPGRVWRGVGPGEALEIRLCEGESGTVLTRLALNREQLGTRIAGLLDEADLRGDAFTAAQVIEHVRHAGLGDRLPSDTQAKLAELAGFYGLDGYASGDDAATETPPPAHETPETESDGEGPPPPLPGLAPTEDADGADLAPVHAALARITAALDAPDGPAGVLADLHLAPEQGRALFLALVETFCLRDEMQSLFNWADSAGLGDFAPGEDDWYNSAILPLLFQQGRMDEVTGVMRRLAGATGAWMVTPAIAWTVRAAMASRQLDEAVRDPVIWAFCDFITRRIWDYWGRTPCYALIDATVALLAARDRLGRDLDRAVCDMGLRAYGLSRRFWERIADAGDIRLTPELIAARDTCAAAAENPLNRAALAPALNGLARAGVADAPRFRRELLGPSGAPLNGTHPDPAALIAAGIDMPEALLRHLAFPGSADPGDDLAEIAAEAMPRFYKSVPCATYAPLQSRIGSRIAALLAPGAPIPEAADVAALADGLATLSGAWSRYLGIGVTLNLLNGSIRSGAQDAADAAFDLLQSLISAREQDNRAAIARAPAVVAALSALQLPAGTDQRAAAALALLPDAVLPGLPDVEAGSDIDNLRGSALFNTLVTVFSCRPNLETRIAAMRAGWLGDLARLGIPHVVVVGNGDGQLRGDVLHLDAPDDYEGLPQKTLATIAWVHGRTRFTHMLKIDDDCFLNAPAFFCGLSHLKSDYHGRPLTRYAGQTDRTWHNAKSTSPRGRLELDKSPEPSTYADGGSGYALSRTAMAAALAAADSPEGRHLIQVSFMEDKLLGDLLSLSGIAPENEEYRISIRRRTHPGGRPVSLWVNGFDASRAAPVKLVHLDAHDTQAEAMQTLNSNRITPKKIWPGFQDMALGYQSNTLELISAQAKLEAAREAPVAVVAAMRNEMFMLPHFLAHYRSLGVESFLIADNCSDDGTLEYLADQPDVALFSVDTDYNLSQYGVAWQTAMIGAFRVGRWSMVADADELLVWQVPQRESLPELLARPEFAEAEAVRLFMLDLYPRGPLSDADFKSGDLFAETGFVDRVPFLTDWPGRGPYSSGRTWTSALRHRLIAGSRPELFVAQKLALMRYQPRMRFAAGLHYAADLRVADRELLLGHFKYNADFAAKARIEVARKQHFNGAEEYRKYLAILAEGREVIFDPAVSVPWMDCGFAGDRLEFV